MNLALTRRKPMELCTYKMCCSNKCIQRSTDWTYESLMRALLFLRKCLVFRLEEYMIGAFNWILFTKSSCETYDRTWLTKVSVCIGLGCQKFICIRKTIQVLPFFLFLRCMFMNIFWTKKLSFFTVMCSEYFRRLIAFNEISKCFYEHFIKWECASAAVL